MKIILYQSFINTCKIISYLRLLISLKNIILYSISNEFWIGFRKSNSIISWFKKVKYIVGIAFSLYVLSFSIIGNLAKFIFIPLILSIFLIDYKNGELQTSKINNIFFGILFTYNLILILLNSISLLEIANHFSQLLFMYYFASLNFFKILNIKKFLNITLHNYFYNWNFISIKNFIVLPEQLLVFFKYNSYQLFLEQQPFDLTMLYS